MRKSGWRRPVILFVLLLAAVVMIYVIAFANYQRDVGSHMSVELTKIHQTIVVPYR